MNVEELLTQPEQEQEPVATKLESHQKAYSTRAEQVAFQEGIIFAEISYGIGAY